MSYLGEVPAGRWGPGFGDPDRSDEIQIDIGTCTMTKLIPSPSVLLYRQAMAELVDQVCKENATTDVDCESKEDICPDPTDALELWTPGLLRPPKIELLWPEIDLKDGHLDGLIQINTSEYFGIMNVYIILEDDKGNPIESGYALDNEVMENHWSYFPSAPVLPGTTVVVRAIAIDGLGNIGMLSESITIP
jgi:hypothetical protein